MSASTDRLRFGTAGLRGPLGDGPQCMNVEQVELAARGIAAWLPSGSAVVIGRDARHRSDDFAAVTARVLSEAGHEPRLFLDPVPTPVVAHVVATTDASAGVVVTASHNPASDNGYKVYTAEGAQLLPEHAAVIESTMAELSWPDSVSTELPPGLTLLGDREIDAYVDTILGSLGDGGSAREPITIAYTAMHGVGGALFVRVLEAAGHRVHAVPEQHVPDPDFPTAPFPNPEEPGTLDLVMALADEVDADIVMANDPDADRLAAARRTDTGWTRLTGDELGVLLGRHIMASAQRPCTVATTIVSSRLLAEVARSVGVGCDTTLTGFKWLARSGSDAAPLVFAYEEALGYAVVPAIRDKDGISAGLCLAQFLSTLSTPVEDGGSGTRRTVDDVLEEIDGLHGSHRTAQVAIRFDGDDAMAVMVDLLAALRSDPPELIGSAAVTGVDDLESGWNGLPPTNALVFHLGPDRVIVRPSGTEPKIKAYLEAVDPDPEVAGGRLAELSVAVRALLGSQRAG